MMTPVRWSVGGRRGATGGPSLAPGRSRPSDRPAGDQGEASVPVLATADVAAAGAVAGMPVVGQPDVVDLVRAELLQLEAAAADGAVDGLEPVQVGLGAHGQGQ